MSFDEEIDFLVVGSGGGGMTAALVAHDAGLKTLVVEKGSSFGGSTALSGGTLWIPNSRHMAAAGLKDSPEEALTYLKEITTGRVSEERLRAYVKYAPEMVQYLAEHSRAQFMLVPAYPDYYSERPGGKASGRSLEVVPYSSRLLGKLEPEVMRSPQMMALGRIAVMASQAPAFVLGSIRSSMAILWLMLVYLMKGLVRYRKTRFDTRLTVGSALAARLRHSLLDRGVPVLLETAAEELIRDEKDGQVVVVGAVIRTKGKAVRVRARHGVLLASGGFAHHEALRQAHQRQPIGTKWTAANRFDQGIALQMGRSVGAAVDLLEDAWWAPVTIFPDGAVQLLVVEKSLPGSILVNSAGQRFTNEAAPYHDVVNQMYAAHEKAPSIPAFLIFDARYRRNYPCASLLPGKAQPDMLLPKELFESGFLTKASSLRELAQKLGIDAAGLERCVARFNQSARRGEDPDFGRGATRMDRYYGDPRVGVNPCLAPLDRAPYYAIRVYPGDIGTKGGLVTDEHARVLSEQGAPIPGLYAAGNCTAAVMGTSYAGAGSTIGPAMTFGYIAAKSAAQAAS